MWWIFGKGGFEGVEGLRRGGVEGLRSLGEEEFRRGDSIILAI
jgi:hypothetical protein